MFDIGFWELVLISIIGLVILGPERLPVVIRSVSRCVTKVRTVSNSVKNEIDKELNIQRLNETTQQVHDIKQKFK